MILLWGQGISVENTGQKLLKYKLQIRPAVEISNDSDTRIFQMSSVRSQKQLEGFKGQIGKAKDLLTTTSLPSLDIKNNKGQTLQAEMGNLTFMTFSMNSHIKEANAIHKPIHMQKFKTCKIERGNFNFPQWRNLDHVQSCTALCQKTISVIVRQNSQT